MNLRQATPLLAAFSIFQLLAGCGSESATSQQIPDANQPAVAVFAPAATRPVERVMQSFQATAGVGFAMISRDATGPMTAADVHFGESFVELWQMAETDSFRPVPASLNGSVTAHQLTDPERRFLPLATSPRGVVFNANLVSDTEIGTLQDFASLADARWRGRLCLSSSHVDGNRLLVAHLVGRHEVRQAEIIVRSWLQNLALPEFESDATLFDGIAAGDCALGVLDLRHLGNAGPPAGIGYHLFPDRHSMLFDIAGVAISRHAAGPEAASELLAWLLTADGSDAYTVGWPELLLGRQSPQPHGAADVASALDRAVPLSPLGFFLDEADLLTERAGYR